MMYKSKSIRTFIGAKNYALSREFYTALGFEEFIIDAKMSLFKVNNDLSFYLQDYYVKKWINNSMVFLEVDQVDQALADITAYNLTARFPSVKLSNMVENTWGREFFLHDPSGVLWHFGSFNNVDASDQLETS